MVPGIQPRLSDLHSECFYPPSHLRGSAVFLKTGSLRGLELAKQIRQTGPSEPGDSACLPSTGITGTPRFLDGYSGPHLCIAGASPTKSLFQSKAAFQRDDVDKFHGE